MATFALLAGLAAFVIAFVLVCGLAGAIRKEQDNQYKKDYRRRRRLEDEVDRDLFG